MLFWRLIKKWHCIRTLKRNLHCLYIFYKAYNLFVFPLGSPKLNFFFEQFQRCSIFIMLSFLSHSKYVRFELFLFAITRSVFFFLLLSVFSYFVQSLFSLHPSFYELLFNSILLSKRLSSFTILLLYSLSHHHRIKKMTGWRSC